MADVDGARQDLQHYVAVVTGASEGGIGYETAKSLEARGARVVLACRTRAVRHTIGISLHGISLPMTCSFESYSSIRHYTYS